MIYKNYNEIPYNFLHDAAMIISKRYTLENIHMDNLGGVDLTLKGKLTENQVKDILLNLNPNPDKCSEDYSLDYLLQYSYSKDMQRTYVYSEDGINYKTLEVA